MARTGALDRAAGTLLVCVLALLAGPGCAGPGDASGQDGAAARGAQALRTGAYADAIELLADAAGRGPVPERVEAARDLAAAHAATGDYAAALAALDRASSSLPAGELARARGLVLRAVGRDEEALAAFQTALSAGASDALPARLDRAVLWWERGERERAYEEFDAFIDAYNEGRARSAAELTAVGTAVRYLGRKDATLFHDAVQAYEDALAADPSALEPRLRMAELFLEKYDGGEAQTLYGEVLAVNPRHPEALVGMARAKRFEGSSESLELVDRALETNPASAPARALRALLQLELGEDEEAVAEAGRALEIDGRSREALAVRAAAWALEGDRRAFEKDRDRALAIDPSYAGFFVTAAELAVRRGRYGRAVELAREGVAVDSTAWEAWAILGMNQLRTGAIDEAWSSLERAFDGDPFNVWTKNTLDLIDRLAGFETVRTDRFELVMHPDEAELLGPYVAEVAEEAYDELSRRFGYRPDTPVRVEFYPSHADFSVRTMGLPGLGALGVAFGNVLALDSPSARDPGAFHWASTLWHEIAHAVTLGRTRHRIPRWLTEGISVREERRSRPGWGGAVGPEFLAAFAEGRLLPLTRIDAGFVRPTYPGQVGISYQHASVVVELIEAEHGHDAVIRMLDAYASGRDTERVFRDVLGVEAVAFDERLREHIRERWAGGLAAVASLDRAHGGDGADPGSVRPPAPPAGPADAVRRARADLSDFAAQLAAGGALLEAGRPDEAEPFLERARDLYPEYAANGSPYDLLARIRRERGDLAGAADALRAQTRLNESALQANLDLAAILEEMGDTAGAAEALERAVFIHPFDAGAHARLADLAVRLDRPALEVRERAAVVALRPVDRAGALYRLALAHRRAGDDAAAREAVMEALEIAPSYADAQDLLLDLTGGGP